MSVLGVTDRPPVWAAVCFKMGSDLVKQAGEPTLAYNLAGRLYLSQTGYLLLTVPNALVRGTFSAMTEPGIELPPNGPDGNLDAHVTVMSPAEVTLAGGPDKITERGKQFFYTLGRVYAVEPDGWPDVAKVWYIKVHSPELRQLRQSYGLSSLPGDGKHDFHVSVAVRRKRVLGRNDTAKGAA
jgi:hypothetical protein